MSIETEEDIFADIDLKGIQEMPEESVEKKEPEKIDIDPDLAIFIIDALISRSICFGASAMGYEIKYNDVKLTAAEIKRIRPLAAKALEKLLIFLQERFPEYFMLFLTLLIIYSSKVMVHAKKKPGTKKKTPVKKPTKTDAKTTKRLQTTNKIKND